MMKDTIQIKTTIKHLSCITIGLIMLQMRITMMAIRTKTMVTEKEVSLIKCVHSTTTMIALTPPGEEIEVIIVEEAETTETTI